MVAWLQWRAHLARLTPGALCCAVVALASATLAQVHHLPAMLAALMLGMALHFLAEQSQHGPGIEFVSRHVLRAGVALLGLRITLADLSGLGGSTIALVLAGMALTLVLGVVLARWMGYSVFFGLLTGGAVAICGASAAMAIAASLPQHALKERATLLTVMVVNVLSTLAMVFYPLWVAWGGLGDTAAGVFIGATIHDVAQVVGAGYSISPKAGDAATLVKLMRVSMLLPVIALSIWVTRHHVREHPEQWRKEPSSTPIPGFVLAFAALMGMHSADWLSPGWIAAGNTTSQWCLLCAMAGIGMKTQMRDMLGVGFKPLLLIVVETGVLALWMYLGIGAWLDL